MCSENHLKNQKIIKKSQTTESKSREMGKIMRFRRETKNVIAKIKFSVEVMKKRVTLENWISDVEDELEKLAQPAELKQRNNSEKTKQRA